MGRDLSDDEYNRECEIEHYTKFSKKVDNDSRYGDYTILKNMQNGQLIMMKEKVVNTREVIDKEIFSNQDKMELSCPYLLKLIDYSTTKQSDFCSTFYKIRSFYEYEPNDLQRESKERQSHGRCFSMEELTHLLYNSIEAGSFLQSHNIPHGDIRPCYLHSCENGTFKLGHRMNDDIPIAQNQINNIVAGKPLYLAPSLFVALKRGNLKVSHNDYKSDVFSLGLCILEAALVRPIQSIYDDANMQFLEGELECLIEEFAVKYPDNPLLITTVRKMLECKEAARPDFNNIKSAIPCYNEVCEYFDIVKVNTDANEPDLTDPYLMHGGQQPQHYSQHQSYPSHQNGYSRQHNPQAMSTPNYGNNFWPKNLGGHGHGHQEVEVQAHRQPQHYGGQSQVHGGSHHGYSNQNNGYDSHPQTVHHDSRYTGGQNYQNYSHGQSQSHGQPQNNYLSGGLKSSHHTQSTEHSNNVSSYNAGGDSGKTKMIDGKLYKEVSDTRTETNGSGHNVTKTYIKYVPVDSGVRTSHSSHAPSMSSGTSRVSHPQHITSNSNTTYQGSRYPTQSYQHGGHHY